MKTSLSGATESAAEKYREGQPVPLISTIVILSLSGILVVSQLYVTIPLAGPMARSFHTSAGKSTWLATSFGIAYAVGFLLAGILTGRLGNRRVLIYGSAITGLITALISAAPNFTTACVLRALQGLSAASFAPAAFAYVAEHVRAERRPVVLTALTSSFLAASVVGQVAAQGMSAWGGWRAPFLGGAVALAGATVLLHRTLRADRAAAAGPVRSTLLQILRVFTSPRTAALCLVSLTVLCGMVALYTGVQLAGPPAVAGHGGVLLAIRASALPAILAVPFAAPRLARYAPAPRIRLALAVAAAAALAMTVAGTSPVGLALLLLLLMAAVSVVVPALVQAMGEAAGPARVPAVACYSFSLFVGASLGSQLAGAARPHGFAAIAGAAAAVLACGAALAFTAGGLPARSSLGGPAP